MSGSGTAFNQATATSRGSKTNEIDFAVRQILARVNTATLVQIVNVHPPTGLSGIGTVDVLPLVNTVDGAGNATPHGVVNGLLYCRIQGGSNAVIIDPAPGDNGVAVFCQRDISAVKATKAQANPGSYRRNSMSDGVYLFGLLNGTPTQYVIFNSAGIEVVSPTAVSITAPNISSNGTWTHTGLLTATGNITAGEGTGDQVDLLNHNHKVPNVESGSGTITTTAPVAGT